MRPSFEQAILKSTAASAITGKTRIQSLWSGYGEISRLFLAGSETNSVVIKHVVLPKEVNHPRGWNTSYSHQRKVTSYQVEMHWYQHYESTCALFCRVPKLLHCESAGSEHLMVLEDLNEAGFPDRKQHLNTPEIYACLRWLANFHAAFLNQKPKGLWEVGTYWHLDTRPDEWDAMEQGSLKKYAHAIDARLKQARYQTLVHGDAKVANFCFTNPQSEVAAVDFQYVGGGCGIKDVAYFLGSCLDEDALAAREVELLAFYFKALETAFEKHNGQVDFDEIEQEWRSLYAFAWADFNRFLLGWMPAHQKLHRYSKRLSELAIEQLNKR